MMEQLLQDGHVPLVTPQAPSPDIHPQSVLYLHMSSNPEDPLRLFIKGRGQINSPLLPVRNRLRKLKFELDRFVWRWRITGILWCITTP